MPAMTALDPVEMSRINNQNFQDLTAAITDLGIHLSGDDLSDLYVFYHHGTIALNEKAEHEKQYSDLLSYATGQLIDKIRYSGVQNTRAFSRFGDFLRSLCPIDPFC
jgi:hypothetical protein